MIRLYEQFEESIVQPPLRLPTLSKTKKKSLNVLGPYFFF